MTAHVQVQISKEYRIKMKYKRMLMGLLFLLPSISLADPMVSELVVDSLEEVPLKTSLYFQTGLFYRLGGHYFVRNFEESWVMAAVDVSFLKLDPNQPTWGWGIHSVISNVNDGGLRFAPKAHYRIPFSKPAGSFFEASAGLYLLAINDFNDRGRLNLPGYFSEAGLGINHFSVVLGAEAFPAENVEEPDPNGWTTSYWVGLKASQGHGLVVLGTMGVLVGLAFIAIANSEIVD